MQINLAFTGFLGKPTQVRLPFGGMMAKPKLTAGPDLISAAAVSASPTPGTDAVASTPANGPNAVKSAVTHEALRLISLLRQCLAQDKRAIALFLGAGCPMAIKAPAGTAPLIPGVEELTKIVGKELSDANLAKSLDQLTAHFTEDGHPAPNIEALLSHIRSLRQVAGKGEVRGLKEGVLKSVEDSICNSIVRAASVPLPDSETPYDQVARWIRARGRERPIEIFSTNYDLLMEQVLERQRVPYFDGFAGSYAPYFDLRAIEEDVIPPRWAKVWKLHGSVNWSRTPLGIIRCAPGAVTAPVIHPSHLKYDEARRLPYFALLDRLRGFLKTPMAVLVLCGYSFRDTHINEVIETELQNNATAAAFGLSFGSLSSNKAAVDLAKRCSGLSVLADDGAVVGSVVGAWASTDPATNIEGLRVDATGGTTVNLGDFASFGRFAGKMDDSRA